MGPKARSSLESDSLDSADSTITPFAGARASSPASSEPAVAADSAKTPLASQPVLSPVFEEDDGFREWSNRSGSYKVVAKLEAVESDFVALMTKDGRRIRVEIFKLSSADRRFLETSW